MVPMFVLFSIAVSFIKNCSFRLYKFIKFILINACNISMRFTHFQATFHHAGIYIPPVNLRGRASKEQMLKELQVKGCKAEGKKQKVFEKFSYI